MEIFLAIHNTPTLKGLLACRPPLNKRYSFLPTVSDFMQTDGEGKIIDNGVSVADFTKKLTISEADRKKHQKLLFANEPVLKNTKFKNFFPVKGGFFGGTSDYVKAVNDVSFDVFPGETLGLVEKAVAEKQLLAAQLFS